MGRSLGVVLLGATLTTAPVSSGAPQGSLVDRAAAAIGGEAPLSTVVLKATQIFRGSGRRSKVEIYLQMPDRFVWKEDAGLQGLVVRGLNHGRLVSNSPPASFDNTTPAQTYDDQLKDASISCYVAALALLGRGMPGCALAFGRATGGAEPSVPAVGGDWFVGTFGLSANTWLPAGLRYAQERREFMNAALVRTWRYESYAVIAGRHVPMVWALYAQSRGSKEPVKVSDYRIEGAKFNVPIDENVFRPVDR